MLLGEFLVFSVNRNSDVCVSNVIRAIIMVLGLIPSMSLVRTYDRLYNVIWICRLKIPLHLNGVETDNDYDETQNNKKTLPFVYYHFCIKQTRNEGIPLTPFNNNTIHK